jgi:hypothetical protein
VVGASKTPPPLGPGSLLCTIDQAGAASDKVIRGKVVSMGKEDLVIADLV